MDHSLEANELSGARRQSYWILRGRFGIAIVSVLNRSLVPHAHEQFHTLFKLGGGDVAVRRSNDTLDLSDNAVVLLNPWESHAVLRNKRDASLILAIEIEQDWLAALLKTHPEKIQNLFLQPIAEISVAMRVQVARVAAAVCGGLTITEARFDEIMSELMTALADDYGHHESARKLPTSNRMIDRRIRRALELLRTRAAENPNLAEIAMEVGLSRSHFFQQFKLCVGVSPQHFLDWQRIELASDKLSTTEMPVADISHTLGFAAASHFTRFFVQHFGLPPSDFRRFTINVSDPPREPYAAS